MPLAISISDNIGVSEKNETGNFVTRSGSQFIKDNAQLRFAAVNKYNLLVSGLSQSSVQQVFADCAALHIPFVRLWGFDTNTTGPLHQLVYPLGSNLITNGDFEGGSTGWSLPVDFTLSTANPHGGIYSLSQNSNGGFNTLVSPIAAVIPNTNYVITFWYNMTNTFSFPDVIRVFNADTNTQMVDGGFIGDTAGLWVQHQLKFNSGTATNVNIHIQNFGGGMVGYFDDFNLSVAATPVLSTIDSGYVKMDMIADEARKAGIKLIVSFVDGNEFNFNGKHTFVSWTNSITPGANITDAFPYSAFFTDSRVQAVYKQTLDDFLNRVNTINGRTYKSDDVFGILELGNELRYNSGDANINTLNSSVLAAVSMPGGWADIMSTYIKSKDPNHLVSFGDMSHTWQYVNNDYVSNGTYYGIDYDYLTRLPNIDCLDFHLYPNQSNGGEIHIFGVRLGFSSSAPTAGGFIAQIQDYVNVGKTNGKPVICTEIGYVREELASNAVVTQYPRLKLFELFANTLFAAGGDGFCIWNAETSDAGSYTFNIGNTWDGNTTNLNYNDIPICNMFKDLNTQGTFRVTANAYVSDSVRTSELEISQVDKYFLSLADVVTISEYTSEINKDPSVDYNSLFEGSQVSEQTTLSQIDNINLSQIFLGPQIIGP